MTSGPCVPPLRRARTWRRRTPPSGRRSSSWRRRSSTCRRCWAATSCSAPAWTPRPPSCCTPRRSTAATTTSTSPYHTTSTDLWGYGQDDWPHQKERKREREKTDCRCVRAVFVWKRCRNDRSAKRRHPNCNMQCWKLFIFRFGCISLSFFFSFAVFWLISVICMYSSMSRIITQSMFTLGERKKKTSKWLRWYSMYVFAYC